MGDEPQVPDEAVLDEEEIIESVPSAADALEEGPETIEEPPADDKEARIKYLEQQLEVAQKKEKEARVKSEAQKAYDEATKKYPYADKDILKEALSKGQRANEINRLAKVTHFAVAKIANKAAATAAEEAERDVAEKYGNPVQSGTAPSQNLSGKDMRKLSVDEMLRQAPNLKRSDRTRI